MGTRRPSRSSKANMEAIGHGMGKAVRRYERPKGRHGAGSHEDLIMGALNRREEQGSQAARFQVRAECGMVRSLDVFR